MLTFVGPGPASKVFTQIAGKVQQILDCSSRFGAVRSPLIDPPAIFCYEGALFIGDLILPANVKIYVKGSDGRYSLSETVKYSDLVDANIWKLRVP